MADRHRSIPTICQCYNRSVLLLLVPRATRPIPSEIYYRLEFNFFFFSKFSRRGLNNFSLRNRGEEKSFARVFLRHEE